MCLTIVPAYLGCLLLSQESDLPTIDDPPSNIDAANAT